MHKAKVAGGLSIAYETFGDPADPPVLLVMGFGAQMIAWHEDFSAMLAGRGRYVIRYDNRDCGLSTRFDDFPVDIGRFIAAVSSGDISAAQAMVPYSLRDLADDGMGLLTALGIGKAHIVGSSMGGMIAQVMAIAYPARVLTLTSMMSSTGESEYGQATPAAQQVLFAPRPADREGYVAASERELVWSSRRYADIGAIRELAARSYDRAYYPAGTGRQLGAMILSGSRADALKTLNVPALVIHGLDDTLIDPTGGQRTAELIPGARLLLIPDMGHDRPQELWADLCDAIEAHTRPDPASIHAAWRLAVAERVAAVHAGNPDLAALTVAGSVGAGLADRFSDLELDCYWTRPPTERERVAAVEALGGELAALWDYDTDDEEWSEDYRVGELDITVSNFLTGTIDRFLDDVLLHVSTEPVRHMRLAAVQRCRPLIGAELIESWRARAAEFPDDLVSALVEQALAPEALSGWSAREALISRGDDLALTALRARTGQAVVRAVLALNRVYLPHRQLKWQRQLTAGLTVSPDRFAERLAVVSAGPPEQALSAIEGLLAEVTDLAEAHSGAGLGEFRETLAERRRSIDPPPAFQ